jgi:hypothetical protein
MSANFLFSKSEEQGIEMNVRKQRGNAREEQSFNQFPAEAILPYAWLDG